MYSLIFTESYVKREIRFLKKHPDIVERYKKVLSLIELNPLHPSLRLHKLKGKQKELYSVSLSIQYRLVIILLINKKRIIPVDVGTHKEVY